MSQLSRRAALLSWLGILISAAGGCGGSSSAPPPSNPTPVTVSQKIKHVVIFQENRTPDNLFHGLPNADIADSGINSSGQIVGSYTLTKQQIFYGFVTSPITPADFDRPDCCLIDPNWKD